MGRSGAPQPEGSMKQVQDIIAFRTRGLGHHDITPEINSWLREQGLQTGLLTVFVQHVLASLSIRQTADRDNLHDYFARIEGYGGDEEVVPRPVTLYATSVQIPVRGGELALGARQGVFLAEQRESPQTRNIVLHLIGA